MEVVATAAGLAGWVAVAGLELAGWVPPGLLLLLVPLFLGYWVSETHRTVKTRTGLEARLWRRLEAALVLAILYLVGLVVLPLFLDRTLDVLFSCAILALGSLQAMRGFALLGTRRAAGQASLWLDSGIMVTTWLLVAWSAFYRDLVASTSLSPEAATLLMFQPTLDVALLTMVLLVLGTGSRHAPEYRFFILPVSISLVADIANSVLFLRGSMAASLQAIGFLAAGSCWILGARAIRRLEPLVVRPTRETLRTGLLPVVPVVIGTLTIAETMREHGSMSMGQFVLGVILVSLILARFGVFLAFHHQTEQRLEAQLAFRTNLLRYVGHEVANPLSPIALQLRLLEQKAGPETARALPILRRNVERLRDLSEQVRTLALAETGTLVERVETVDLNHLVDEAVRACELVAGEKGQAVTLARPQQPVLVAGHRQRLGQVVDNLLSNASKYSPPEARIEVTIAIHVEAATIVVKDHGAGLTEHQLASLFTPFQRHHAGLASGTGLGLHISRSIVEACGGRLTATSGGPGKGSTFTVRLPASRKDAVAPPPKAATRGGKAS